MESGKFLVEIEIVTRYSVEVTAKTAYGAKLVADHILPKLTPKKSRKYEILKIERK